MPLYVPATPLASARMRGMATGAYYPVVPSLGSPSGGTLNRLVLVPFFIDEATTFDRIASYVTTAAGSSLLRWGIYTDTAGVPGTTLLDTGAVGDASVLGICQATISLTLPAGKYWAGSVHQGVVSSCQFVSGATIPGIGYRNATDIANAGTIVGWAADSVSGALPSPFTIGFAQTSAPLVYLRKA